MAKLVALIGIAGALVAAGKFQYSGPCFWSALGMPALAILYWFIGRQQISSKDGDIAGGIITDDLDRIHAAVARHEKDKRTLQYLAVGANLLLAIGYIVAVTMGYCSW